MLPLAEIRYDAASAQHQGRREHQEDAVVTDFPAGAGMGFAVLADGMGGHAAGDVASKIVATEIFSELKMRTGDPGALEAEIAAVLHDAVHGANECIRMHAEDNPHTYGMGSTLVAPVLFGSNLYWISVGDSPLYLMRDGELRRLNQDHSMGPQIEYLVNSGAMSWEAAMNHPDRNSLTSVLIGDEIAQIDCPALPVRLRPGDIVVAASDGLQFLADEEIAEVLEANADRPCTEIIADLLRCLSDLDDPDQDNISVCVIKVEPAEREAAVLAATPLASELLPAPTRKRKTMTFVATATSKPKGGKGTTYRISMEQSA